MKLKKKSQKDDKRKPDIYEKDTSLRQQDLEKFKPRLKPKNFYGEG